MEGAQRGAHAGCSGTVDNLLIDQMVKLDCHRRKRDLSMGWVDVKKAYDSIDRGWLEEMMLMHRFPTWLCRAIQSLSRSWNTGIVTTTRKGREVSDTIRFGKGLSQGDALCPRLFTVCLNPIAWKISAFEGYRLSKPIDTKVTDLLYIDDLKIFAASESRLSCVIKSVKAVMEDVGLQWNPKKCAVVHFKRGTHVAGGLRSIETEYEETKVKAAVNLYQNRDLAMKMVRDFEERAESVRHQALTTEAAVYAKEYGLQLQLEYPDSVCVTEEGEVIPGKRIKNVLKRHRESREREDVR